MSEAAGGELRELTREVDSFDTEREWGQFHSPKNLSMALSIEASELLEVFRWLSEDESRRLPRDGEDYSNATAELADVLINVLRLANALGIDLAKAVHDKLAVDAVNYPVATSRGNARKYRSKD